MQLNFGARIPMRRDRDGYVSTVDIHHKGRNIAEGHFYIDYSLFGKKSHLGNPVHADMFVVRTQTVLVEEGGDLFALTEDDFTAWKNAQPQ